MVKAIHIEMDALCLLVLCYIVWQSIRNINQQMRKIRFRNTVYAIMVALALDIIWMLVDGARFPGDRLVNSLVNALFLGAGVVIGCLWYLYVLDTLGYRLSAKMSWVVMLPGIFFMILNLLSIKTEWVFYITDENVYVRGPLFWLQELGAVGMLMVSFVHILLSLFFGKKKISRRKSRSLLSFYVIPVIGTLISMPYTGMPGAWTCASVSIILIYLSALDREILRDSLTGLNNRKALDNTFTEYVKSSAPENRLTLFMMDLDGFKDINDMYGHPTGDQALIDTGKLLLQSIQDFRSIAARYGGDEFLVMGFPGSPEEYKGRLEELFADFNESSKLPCGLYISVGYAEYEPGQSLETLIGRADEQLYREKRRKSVGRSRN